MNVKILKPDATLFEGEVSLIQLPGAGGMFEMLDNHAPIIAALQSGSVRIKTAEGERIFEIAAGVVRGQQNEILVLVQ